jgi:lipoyl-dependent peroxiredoxin
MERQATAQWRGNTQEGMGFVRTESGSLKNVPFSFAKRFGDEPGTNPEELIAAAISSCFAMAMASELDKKNLKAETIDARSSVTLEKTNSSWEVIKVHLSVSVFVPKGNKIDVLGAASLAKGQCPISKLLNTEITMDFHPVDHQGIELL